MDWTKVGQDQWVYLLPPDARLRLEAQRMGDGRWSWKITAAGTHRAAASGIVSTPGAAKHAMEQFLKKAGIV